MSNTYLQYMEQVARQDVLALFKAEKNYGDSWKKRGGVGAFMMLARKWDRLENFVSKLSEKYGGNDYDILGAVEEDKRPEGIIDDIRDLRRYLLLVEAELAARGVVVNEVLKDIPSENTSLKQRMSAPPLKWDDIKHKLWQSRNSPDHPAPFGFEENEDTLRKPTIK